MRARWRPWRARSEGSSPTRERTTVPASTFAVTPPSSACTSSPLGPFTLTDEPSTVTVTPDGIGTGIFPMRDMGSPDLAEDLAADAVGAGLAVREHPAARRQHADAEPVQDPGQLADAAVRAAARLAHAADRRDD